MAVTIQKWGNSHAVRLPKAVMEQAGLSIGTPVQVAAKGDTITIKPSRGIRRIPLNELLKGMTPGKNRYPKFNTQPVGKEVI